MWFLTNAEGHHIYIKPGTEVTFGRKKGDILLENDNSISKLHAAITVIKKDFLEDSEFLSTCILRDCGSKYGTYVFVNNRPLELKGTEYHLEDQQNIRFGLQNHNFKVHYLPILTVLSSLSCEDKAKLTKIIDEIGGIVADEWVNKCTHLTVSKPLLTEKVTWALTSIIPIVHMKYWEEVAKAIEMGLQLPNPNNFVPHIGEGILNKDKVSLSPNEKRKSLFKGLIFVHFTAKQFKVYGKMAHKAGGKCILYAKKPLSMKDLCATNVIVLRYPISEASQSTQCIVPEYDEIYEKLQEVDRRMVDDSEIPLAILHCSVEMYCNPKFKYKLRLAESKFNNESARVIVPDTQDIDEVHILPKVISDVPIKSHINVRNNKISIKIIPETCDAFDTQDCIPLNESLHKTSLLKQSQPHIPQENTANKRKVVDFGCQEAKGKTSAALNSQTAEKIQTNSEYVPEISGSKTNAVIIPETNDFSINLSPAKCSKSLEKEHIDLTISPSPKRSRSVSPDAGGTIIKNPFYSPVKNKVVHWLASLPEGKELTNNPVRKKLVNRIADESPKRKIRRSRIVSDSELEEDCIVLTEKSSSKGIHIEDTFKTPTTTVKNCNNSTENGASNTSLNRSNSVKVFQKVYRLIPDKRISTKNMISHSHYNSKSTALGAN